MEDCDIDLDLQSRIAEIKGKDEQLHENYLQGLLTESLNEDKNNPEIMKHQKSGKVNITWAIFPKELLEGIETYLSYKLNPTLGERCPIDFLIPVNLPINL